MLIKPGLMRTMRAACCVATTITTAPCMFSDIICFTISRRPKMRDMHSVSPVATVTGRREEGVRSEVLETKGGDWTEGKLWLDVGE